MEMLWDLIFQFDQKLAEFLISQEVAIELVRVIFTALAGYITFRVYQRYRNKKDNTRLYIVLIKLERELEDNMKVLKAIIDMHSDYDLLKEAYLGEIGAKRLSLYRKIDSLGWYTYEDLVIERERVLSAEHVYAVRPYMMIKGLTQVKDQIQCDGESFEGQLDEIDAQLRACNECSIYDVLGEIEELARDLLSYDLEANGALEYLCQEISAFNLLKQDRKDRRLHEFCVGLVDKENVFSKTLSSFRRFEELDRRVTRPENLKQAAGSTLTFKLWRSLDVDLLGVYDPDYYLELDEYYCDSSSISIGDWERDRAITLRNRMNDLLHNRLIRTRVALGKTLSKTNWLFGDL